MPASPSDIDVLLPAPKIWKFAGVELRQTPLKNRQLLAAIKYVETNKTLIERLVALGKPGAEGTAPQSFSGFIEEDLLLRLNGLMRLLLPDNAEILTDEWCLDYMTTAHYAAFLKTALVQNELYDLFTTAKGFVGRFMTERLRRVALEAATESTAS